jgi:D-galactarolactone isomerase
MLRTFTGTPPRTKLPPGSIDTQMHMYLPGYPSAPGSIPLPAAAPGPDEYRQVMRWLGVDRVIITQGNAHGRDNANLLACLAAMGDCARGVGIIDATTSEKQMAELAAAGVVGARIMDLPGGAVGLSELREVDARAFERGWYLAVQFNGSDILDHLPLLLSLRSRWVLDHHGKFLRGTTPDSREIGAVKRLLDTGRCWYKLAGCYESSLTGAPDFADVAAMTRTVAAHAPTRVVWGTNWPHNQAANAATYPDDARLLDRVLGWLPDDDARRLAVTDNAADLVRVSDWNANCRRAP